VIIYDKEIQFNKTYKYSTELEKELIKIILQGASEIKNELNEVFNEVIKNKWTNHSDAYFELCKSVLTSTYLNVPILKTLPESVIKLSGLFWFKPEKIRSIYDYDGIGVEKYYSLNEHWDHDYFPASAFQTPIYWLLRFSFKEAINFILDFTNKSVQSYVDSGFDKSVEDVEVIIDDKTRTKQFISSCLWNMYRGTGSPITPYLLQSVHMALEKNLIEISKTHDENIVESWLIYLIKQTKSASITSIVTSVVLAYPEKFFNVAKILFGTIKFLQFDNMRAYSETQALSLYSIGYGLNYKTKTFEDERIKTCSDTFRKTSLEHLILNYQFIRSKSISDKDWDHRQKEIYKVIDEFYSKLPEKSKESDDDKRLKLLLARIDKRKMKPELEQKNDQLLINLNPEIEPELKIYSEDAITKSLEMMKYSSLRVWSIYKFDKNKKYEDYEQYEKDPKLVLKETKEIIESLKNTKDSSFILFNHSVPPYTCSALIKEYEKELTIVEKQLCKEVIIQYATEPFRPNYQYQISDGVEVSINTLPFLFKLFPEDKDDFKMILLFILFDPYPIGHYKRVCDYSIESIIKYLWDISFEDAQDIFLGYLMLKPLFNEIKEAEKAKNRENFTYKVPRSQILEKFNKDCESELNSFISKKIKYDEINIQKYPLEIIETAFQLLPSGTINETHLKFIKSILPALSKTILVDNDRIEFSLRHRFLEKYSYFILERETKFIVDFLQPFIENFTDSEEMADFFQELISTENKINKYEQFWIIWEYFYEKIVTLCKSHSNYYQSRIVHNYLLAWPYWGNTTKEWHSLKEKEKQFYIRAIKDMGQCTSVLDSISKLLNEIGSGFLNDGIFWISEMIDNNKNLSSVITRLLNLTPKQDIALPPY